jgi:hypothetical protein
MFGRTYFHDTMRKYVILFGTLFNDVWINREDSQGNVKDVLKIPLTYGPRDKHLARIQGLNDGYDAQQQQFAMVVPRMGFEITGFNYAPERKLSTINKYTIEDIDGNKDKRYYQYMPVPYDITFNLSVFVKNSVDGTRIVEQIVPYFTPEWTSTVQLIEEPDITLDVPLILNAVSLDESYEGGFEDRRVQIWNLDFTMKCQLFGPIYQQKIIKLTHRYSTHLVSMIFLIVLISSMLLLSLSFNQDYLLITNQQFIHLLILQQPQVSQLLQMAVLHKYN